MHASPAIGLRCVLVLLVLTIVLAADGSAFAAEELRLVPQRSLSMGFGVVSADGRWAAAPAGGIALWDLERGVLVREIDEEAFKGERPLAICASPPTLITGTWKDAHYDLVAFSLDSGVMKTLGQVDLRPESAACSASGAELALTFATASSNVRLVNLSTGATTWRATLDHPSSVAFVAKDRLFVTTERLEELDRATGKTLRVLAAGTGLRVGGPIAVSHDGTTVATSIGGADEGLGTAIWDVASGKILQRVQRKIEGLTTVGAPSALSPDGKRALVTAGKNRLFTLDVTTGESFDTGLHDVDALAFQSSDAVALLDGDARQLDFSSRTIRAGSFAPHDGVSAVALDPKGELAYAVQGSRIAAWKTRSLELAWSRTFDSSDVSVVTKKRVPVQLRSVSLSEDGMRLATLAGDHLEIADAKNGRSERRIPVPGGEVGSDILIRKDEVWLFSESWNGRGARGFRISTGEALAVAGRPRERPRSRKKGETHFLELDQDPAKPPIALPALGLGWQVATFKTSPDIVLSAADAIVRWDPTTRKTVASFATPARFFAFAMAVSSDDARVAVSHGGGITILDARDLRPIQVLPVPRSAASQIAFDPTGRFLLEGDQDGTVRLHELAKRESVSWITDGEQWIAFAPDGTFHASRDGGRLLAAVRGFAAFRVDQLAIKLNRPDKLLSRMGLESAERIARLAARHRRRLARLGLDEATVDAALLTGPSVRIQSLVQSAGTVELEALLEGSAGLASYQIFVNDVPLFAKERSLTGTRQSIRERVELIEGENTIEVSARGKTGVESLRAYRRVESRVSSARSLYFLGLGISRYDNPDLALAYAHKDVNDVADVLRAAGQPFAGVQVRTFTDAQVTREALEEARVWLSGAKVHDTVVVLVTGHGVYDAAGEYFYLLKDADVARLRETAASFELLESLIAGLPARRKLLVLDTCESGELDPEDERRIGATPALGGLRSRAARGVSRVKLSGSSLAQPAAARFDDRSFLTNDLVRRTGAVVLSSSRGAELSWENQELQNGVFSEALLEALTDAASDLDKDGLLSTDELLAYVSPRVASLTADAQHPTIDRDNRFARLSLPLVPAARAVVTRQEIPAASAKVPTTTVPPGCRCDAVGARGGSTSGAVLGSLLFAGAALRARRRREARARS